MDKHFLPIGKDFYSDLTKIENKLLEIGALSGKNKKGYINAFETLLEDENIEWKGYFVVLSKTVLKEFDVGVFKLQFSAFCSNIDLTKDKIECNSNFLQKYLFRQLSSKSSNDADILNGLFLFTDFSDEISRQNMTYLLLLNLEEKYGSVVRSIEQHPQLFEE